MKLKLTKIKIKGFFVSRVLLIPFLTCSITFCGDESTPDTGSGTKNDPYTIRNYTQLLCMGRAGATTSNVDCGAEGYTGWGLDKHYKLEGNINASASCPGYDGTNGNTITCGDSQTVWTPLGDCGADEKCADDPFATTTDEGKDDRGFAGSFDGAGFTVSKLYYKINTNSRQFGGLFGYVVGATIKNVGIVDGHIDVTSSAECSEVGGLVGRVIDSSISNSYATGDVSVSSLFEVGGLVGYMNNASISNSYATGDVSASSFFSTAGGLLGYMDDGSISNSYATGDVSASDYTGGLVGIMRDSSSISNSYATGNVSSSASAAGGLAGDMDDASISNSYATGDVSASSFFSAAGGLVGYMNNASISNSYATGNISASDYTGGLGGDYAG